MNGEIFQCSGCRSEGAPKIDRSGWYLESAVAIRHEGGRRGALLICQLPLKPSLHVSIVLFPLRVLSLTLC